MFKLQVEEYVNICCIAVYTNTTLDGERQAGRLPFICDLGLRHFKVRSSVCYGVSGVWSDKIFVYAYSEYHQRIRIQLVYRNTTPDTLELTIRPNHKKA